MTQKLNFMNVHSGIILTVLFVAFAVWSSGCGEEPIITESLDEETDFDTTDQSPMKDADVDVASDVIVAVVGGTFLISLESNPTTGYSWQPVFDSEYLQLIGSEFNPDSTLIGAPGLETFEFKALKQGETEVTMIYKRPWEEEHIKEQTKQVNIGPPNAAGLIVSVGEIFNIGVGSNPSTGYTWELEFDPEFLQLLSREFRPDSGLVGALGMEKFELQALKEGETQVKMTYKRPWEKEHLEEDITPVTIVP